MRIMVINYEFPPVGGGGGRIAADLCRYLARFGHEVLVQTSWHPSLPRQETRDGYRIRRSFALRRRLHTCTVPEMAAYLLFTAAPTLKQVLTWQPDILQVHFAVPTGVLGWLAHRLTGIPYLLSAHLGDVPGGTPAQTDHLFRWLKPLTRPIWQAAAAVTAPAAHIRDLAQAHYGRPVVILPNGIDLPRHLQAPAPPSDPVRLLFAGRLSHQKNPLFLIRALAHLKHLPWHLEILGDGPFMAAVRDLVMTSGLAAKVSFRGWVPPEEVLAAMQTSDILLLPSLSEGLPLVGVQALAAGLALLGSQVGGINDVVVNGKNGFLVPVNDLEAFVQRLQAMLRPEVLLPMKRASQEMARAFDLSRIARRLETLLRSSCRKTDGRT